MGNYSRDTFELNKLKHYVGVRLQQGVPLVDADWNEMDDTRKEELRSFLKNFIGDGVPLGNGGFAVVEAAVADNDFTISAAAGEPGRCLVDGWEVGIESNIDYTAQPLYENQTLADLWGVTPLSPLTPPGAGQREDIVYLDVWEREVDAAQDSDIVNPAIGIETCVRIKREWTVRVAEGAAVHPEPPQGHVFYDIARITRAAGVNAITAQDIKDLRQVGLNLRELKEFIDSNDIITSAKVKEADGTTGQDTSLGDGIKTGHIQEDAVTSAKVKEADGTTGQDTSQGDGIKTGHIQDDAVTSAKIKAADGTTGQDLSQGDGIKSGHIQDGAITATKLDETIWETLASFTDILVGSVAPFAAATPPEGWLECDGQAVSRIDYQKLFDRIGTTFGAGDGATTFNVPDLRGEFIRGWDGSRGVDPSRTLGSAQNDQMQGHKHSDSGHSHSTNSHGHSDYGHSHSDNGHSHAYFYGEFTRISNSGSEPTTYSTGTGGSNPTGHASIATGYANLAGAAVSVYNGYANLGNPAALSNGTPRIGNETRPRNVALMYCIKY